MRVAAGGVAHKVPGEGVSIRGALVRIGGKTEDRVLRDWDAVGDNPFFCPDAAAVAEWADCLDSVRKAGSSVGAVIEIVAEGVPAGLDEPAHGTLDGDLAAALMSINAVKGVEMGDAFAAAAKRGEAVGIVTTGRHDPCVGIRAVPAGEAMMAPVLAGHLLRHHARTG